MLRRAPEAFRRSLGFQPDQVSSVDTFMLETWEVRELRRADDHNLAAIGRYLA